MSCSYHIIYYGVNIVNVAFDYEDKSSITPICNSIDSMTAAFKLLTALCSGCVENLRTLYGLLHSLFYTGIYIVCMCARVCVCVCVFSNFMAVVELCYICTYKFCESLTASVFMLGVFLTNQVVLLTFVFILWFDKPNNHY